MIVSLDDDPDVVAVIPTLAGDLSRLRACIESVCRSELEGRLAVVVVWNDPRILIADLGPVTILEPGMNLGLPGGMNFARAAVTSPRMWIMQDDMTVEPECLQVLVDRQDRSDSPAVVSPIILNEQGLVPVFSRAGAVTPEGVMEYWYPFEDCLPAAIDASVRLDWVALSGALVRCDAWDRIGGMNALYFPLLYTDVDLGCRMTQVGMRSVLEPNAIVTHERSGSTPGLFAQFLGARHAGRFQERHREGHFINEENSLLVDRETVAREASVLVVDFAQHAEVQIKQAREMIQSLEAKVVEAAERATTVEAAVIQRDSQLADCLMAIENLRLQNQQLRDSHSMRVTRPLRAVGSLARKIAGT